MPINVYAEDDIQLALDSTKTCNYYNISSIFKNLNDDSFTDLSEYIENHCGSHHILFVPGFIVDSFTQVAPDQINTIFKNTLQATFMILKEIVLDMILTKKQGNIILVSDINTSNDSVLSSTVIHSLKSLIISLAKEYGSKLLYFNYIVLQKQSITDHSFKELILFLLSKDSSFINGETFEL